eukprot:CAMPEP_0198654790 /NCGR_PEP_ID=MMETSP1467-20131203/7945_1 /TAXON_ID=1462469 /ORGANISM="unid. sp., Strain CCMP2135" /LENGTH=263 /DNA_ID=CAMNT_0044390789 /DNA_START=12 /DNA_END=803 /DNA_ORIENTATION=+
MSALVLSATRKFSVVGREAPAEVLAAERPWNAAAPKAHVATVLEETTPVVVVATQEEEEEEAPAVQPPEEEQQDDGEWVQVDDDAEDEWQSYVDPETQHPYWYNAKRDESSWEAPPGTNAPVFPEKEEEWERVETERGTYYWNAAERKGTMAVDESGGEMDALRVELEYLRAVQVKLVEVVTAMHQRFAQQEASDARQQSKLAKIEETFGLSDRQLLRQSASEPKPRPKARREDPVALDKALSAAMRQEELRFFASQQQRTAF